MSKTFTLDSGINIASGINVAHGTFAAVGFWCQTIHKKFLRRFDTILGNDDEKWSRKKYFEIPRWPSELLLPSAKKSAQKG